METVRTYNDKVVRQFTVATILWGIVGMAVGAFIAAQLAWPALNFDIPWLTYSRLRPLHTNAVIFAFGGCALMGTAFYVVQRTCQARLFSDRLAAFVFWGWQLVIVAVAITLPLGITQSKEYAEPEWPIDILIAIVWVAFGIVFFGTIVKRRVKHIYVANWFYGAFIITVAVLHIVNNLALPVGLWKSYPVYSGAVDAMVQWWYGHNAVGFFLTAGFLGMMYYYVPKQAQRPVYSYRLSVVHFWALISVYMWAGPHHLQYTALPDWAQSLGMVFSLILLAPSWGGMINGMMTLSGAWHKLRTDPILKFMIVSLSFYGMSTFEGPMMSIKTVNSLSHYTDWTIGHVHAGALGWVAFISIGSLYCMIPRLLGLSGMYSTRAIDLHFWIATIGVVVYIASMWIAGVMQGLMWRATNPDGTLTYTFIESVAQTHPFYITRLVGGLLVLSGMFIMVWNTAKTWAMARQPVAAVPIPTVVAA
ncbi:MAG: cytochrome-c oxidase, cbb3-type subunit I [Proteobacteria bacterium]|uniref:cytochrome-c oxidase, cbb3-type subunit I n=1 Tax=Rudaea sp. TaxID=2136325 RepID=UPI001DB59C9A|nr:cytochrome-c oxidase, cbb3-type subunit I [Pseudomonadota bacterium]MBS0566836.1 cytochrome-c oxidase, cbb3-type subunit I [Pseudomonadota bacterium]